MPKADAAQAPAANYFSQPARTVQECLAWAEGELIDSIYSDIVANVKDAGSVVAWKTIDILRSIGLAASN